MIKHSKQLFVSSRAVWESERELKKEATRWVHLARTAVNDMEKWECLGRVAALKNAAEKLMILRLKAVRMARRPNWSDESILAREK